MNTHTTTRVLNPSNIQSPFATGISLDGSTNEQRNLGLGNGGWDFGHEELNQLTGIAAILTYPLDIEVVEAEERAEAEERERQRLEALEIAG